jgi:acetyl esterase/lipase
MIIKLNTNNFINIDFIDHNLRDLVLILPGGAYQRTSSRESSPVASVFKNNGYHTAIFNYREDILLYPKILEEAYQFLLKVKSFSQVDKIYLIGFSAGGHFATMISIKYFDLISGTILAYPVISTNKKIMHEFSMNQLLGSTKNSELLKEVSLEKQTHKNLKPFFIMHTIDDQSVKVENSLRLINSLVKNKIYVETHLYPKGKHGISLATKEVSFEDMDPIQFFNEYGYMSNWINLAIDFLKRINL